LCKIQKQKTRGQYSFANKFVKSAPGVNFPNIFCAAFTSADPKRAKRCWPLDWILGSFQIKAAYKHVGEIDSGVNNFINILRANFSYQSLFRSFFLVTFWQKKHFRMKNSHVKCWWNWPLEKEFEKVWGDQLKSKNERSTYLLQLN